MIRTTVTPINLLLRRNPFIVWFAYQQILASLHVLAPCVKQKF